jgi:hypothetical protein
MQKNFEMTVTLLFVTLSTIHMIRTSEGKIRYITQTSFIHHGKIFKSASHLRFG